MDHVSVVAEFHFSIAECSRFAWLALTSDRENIKPFLVRFVFSNARADFRMRALLHNSFVLCPDLEEMETVTCHFGCIMLSYITFAKKAGRHDHDPFIW